MVQVKRSLCFQFRLAGKVEKNQGQRQIGMMEAAGYNALEPFCEGDEVSVGTAINIVHRAAATVGMKITTEAVLESFDGRFYTFKVNAHNGIEVIGYGTIARAIVSKAKFEEKQRQKQKVLATD